MNRVMIGSDNGLVPDQYQAITYSNDDISLIGPSKTTLCKIWIET